MKCSKCNHTYKGLKESICFNCKNNVSLVVVKSSLLNDRKDINGLLYSMYQGQKGSSKQRGHTPPKYSLTEFKQWAFNKTNYKKLFKAYQESNFDSNLVPSVNRLDESVGYSLDNIEMLTWKDHRLKGKGSGHKAVKQFYISGKYIKTFRSLSDAARELGSIKHVSYLSLICRSGGGVYQGFRWEFR